MQDLLIPFVAVLLAEFFDKSQLSLFLLASKTRKRLPLLLGAISAFILIDGSAILFGSFLSNLISPSLLKIVSGVIFVLFGITLLFSHNKEGGNRAEKMLAKNAFFAGLILVSISELGDKTQLAATLFATQFNPLLVFCGVMGALTLLSLISVYLGSFFAGRVNQKLLTRITGVLFLLIALMFFFL